MTRNSFIGEAEQYIAKFCAQRKQGLSGRLQWDSFLLHVYKSGNPPLPVELYDWLQANLHSAVDIEHLVEDYQRVGVLLSRWQDLHATAGSGAHELPVGLIAELSKPVSSGGLPLGGFVDLQTASLAQCALTPAMRQRNPHVLLVGRKNTGTTELMLKMIKHDFSAGDRAVVIVDAYGELTDLVQDWMKTRPDPVELEKRSIVIDPAHQTNSPGYNPLDTTDDVDLSNIAAGAVYAFKSLYREPPGALTQWNQQTANILRNSIILLALNGKTLADLPVLLSDNNYRDLLLEKTTLLKNEKPEYMTLLDSWSNYKRLARTDQWINWIEPIFNRIHPALCDPRIRPILTGSEGSCLNLTDVIVEKKLLIVSIPKKDFDENGELLGSLIVARLRQCCAAVRRRFSDSRGRKVAVYMDGMDNLVDSEIVSEFTSEQADSEIGLIASTRDLSVFDNHRVRNATTTVTSADIRGRVIDNFGQVGLFSVTREDAEFLAARLPHCPEARAKEKCGFSAGWTTISESAASRVESLSWRQPGDYLWWHVHQGYIVPLCLLDKQPSTEVDALPMSITE